MNTIETSTTPDRGYMGDRKRGASLGRGDVRGDHDTSAKFHVRKVRLNSGGYDPGGAYWGHGGELFEAWSEEADAYMTCRVWPADRTAAFERRGGVRIGEPGSEEFRQRFPHWSRDGSREAAKDAVREAYPEARFYR